MLICIISSILAFVVTTVLVPKILLISVRKKILDVPDNRKIHTKISSRLGGVAFFPSLIITICVIIPVFHLIATETHDIDTYWLILSLGAGFLMYIVGISDDIQGISYKMKFTYQVLASIMIIASGTWINNLYGFLNTHEIPMWIGHPLTVLFCVFIMNAINLIDGIDGLSSGLSIIAFCFYGVVFYTQNQAAPTILSFAIVGALLGFFRYNLFGFPNRSIKIFMGDTGTLFIGTTLSLLALRLMHFDTENGFNNQTDILIAYSVLIVPCFDVIRVMLHRLKNKRHIFSPDKNHIHHKILALGFSTKQTLFIILAFSVFLTLTNVLLNKVITLEYIMIFDAIIWTGLNIMITKKKKKRHA